MATVDNVTLSHGLVVRGYFNNRGALSRIHPLPGPEVVDAPDAATVLHGMP